MRSSHVEVSGFSSFQCSYWQIYIYIYYAPNYRIDRIYYKRAPRTSQLQLTVQERTKILTTITDTVYWMGEDAIAIDNLLFTNNW